MIYHDLSNDQAALEDYEKAIAMDPTDPEPYFNRSELEREKGDEAAAAADRAKWIELKGRLRLN